MSYTCSSSPFCFFFFFSSAGLRSESSSGCRISAGESDHAKKMEKKKKLKCHACNENKICISIFSPTHTLTEQLADAHHTAEHWAREADEEPEGEFIGQNQPQGFVLGCEAKTSISVDPILIQRPRRPQQPLLLLLPPKRMI